MTRDAGDRLDRTDYELVVDERFESGDVDRSLWAPWYLPHWSSRAASAARFDVGGGSLRLRIDADTPPWNPEADGEVRVSALQTGLFAGPVGSPVGQHRFRDGLVVREAQERFAGFVPRYGLFEVRFRALADRDAMVAVWMIGYEDEPERSAEICLAEIFGRDVEPGAVTVGLGVHPFGDPALDDDFARVRLPVDARAPHDYAVEWAPDEVRFFVDEQLVRASRQSPAYPMQFMVTLYEFRDAGRPLDAAGYPKVFVVERFRGYRPRGSGGR